MTGYIVTEKAVADLNRHAQWLAREAGTDVASRFLDSAKETFGKLSDNSGWGRPISASNGRLRELRKWNVAAFPKVLVFYRPITDAPTKGVEIIRVFHAAQDWIAVLDEH